MIFLLKDVDGYEIYKKLYLWRRKERKIKENKFVKKILESIKIRK